jgi:spore coat protein H
VRLNGKSLGIYSNVESIRESFLKQHFSNPKGNLYEGTVHSDHEKDRVAFLQTKTNKKKNKREDLQALVTALESGDETLLSKLGAHLDLAQFYKYWACEELTGHWDSYASNLNNYYLYSNPESGKFIFILWGADSRFGIKNPFKKFTPPESVKAYPIIPRRLYDLEPSREAYRKVLRGLLDTVWDEGELLEEIERMSALT